MDTLLNGLSWICILSGGFFVVAGGVGLLRFPDFFTRLHAASVTDTLGAGLILLGLMLQSGFPHASIKLILILMFLFISSPTAAHALAKAALHGKLAPFVKRRS